MEGEPTSPSSSSEVGVTLSDCIVQHVLHFTLSSSITDETLEEGVDVGLSKEYCSNLLLEDETHSKCLDTSGVPPYPLYKRLASSLHQCISSGAFVKTSDGGMQFSEDDLLEKKKDVWNDVIHEKGDELVKMFKGVDFELHVQEPYFSQLRAGTKTIEGRCAVGDYKRIQTGSLLLVNKCLLLKVQEVECYASFAEMLEAKSLEKVLPGTKTIEEGVQIYRKFYTEEKEQLNGVLAIRVSKPDSQPYIAMANIVSGLSYEGIASLLGLMHTAGTVRDALPPPRSVLLSSFLVPHNPIV